MVQNEHLPHFYYHPDAMPVRLQLSEELSLKKGVSTFKIYLIFPHVSYTEEEEFLYLYSQTNPQHLVQRNAAAAVPG